MESWLVYLEGLAKQSGIANWLFSLLFVWLFLIVLYGTARLVSILIVKWMPEGKLRRWLLQRAPD